MLRSSVRRKSTHPAVVLGLAGAIFASMACDNSEQDELPTAKPAGIPAVDESKPPTPPDRAKRAHFAMPAGTVTDRSQRMGSMQAPSEAQTSDPNGAKDKPAVRAVVEGHVHRGLRGWAAPGKVIVTIEAPVEKMGTLELGKYELREGEQLLGGCIGIVPSTDVKIAYAGHLVELRESAAIPIEDLRPVIDVKEEHGSNLTLTGDTLLEFGTAPFWRQSRTTERLVVGQGLTLTPEGDRHVFIAASGPTYILFSDGWQIVVTRDEAAKRAGVRLSEPAKLRLIFAIRDTEASNIELIRGSATGSEILGQIRLLRNSFHKAD